MEKNDLQIGDLVLADYVTGISGQVAQLRGVLVSMGEFDGRRTTSVYGQREGTSSSTMAVELIATASSPEAQKEIRGLLDSGRWISAKGRAALEAALV